MLNTHLNIEQFSSGTKSTTFSLECDKSASISEAKLQKLELAKKECKKLTDKNIYDIEYKKTRETLFKLYEEIYNACSKKDKTAILEEIRKNIESTQTDNNEKKKKNR